MDLHQVYMRNGHRKIILVTVLIGFLHEVLNEHYRLFENGLHGLSVSYRSDLSN